MIIYVVSGACGFLLSSMARRLLSARSHSCAARRLTVGASASIFGLLGALMHYGRKSGSSLIHGQAKQWAIIMFIYGLFMPGIDNFAHAGGFLGGYAMSALFNPLTRERGDHMLIAVLCLLATFLAIAASRLQGLGGYAEIQITVSTADCAMLQSDSTSGLCDFTSSCWRAPRRSPA